MKLTAIIFDLFGTLVDNMSVKDHKAILSEVADVISVPADQFIIEWNGAFRERATGQLPTTEAAIQHVCDLLGTIPDEGSLRNACRLRTEYTRRILVPRSDALSTLTSLRSAGFSIGLITDCTCEIPPLWEETRFAPLFNATVFSCDVGVKKPDPRIYSIACSRLDVKPANVLYIGDGSSHELTGARSVGMTPVLIDPPHERQIDPFKIDEESWDGMVVHTLAEIPELLRSLNENFITIQ